tara:strand:+ start:6078 stop:7112 length:1035 start_codon:yes stop_codon:yes gene_type:complete
MSDDYKTPENLRQELKRLETAVGDHISWLKDWHLRILGAGMTGETVEINNAAIDTPFRNWYYSHARDAFGDSPAYPALGFSLETMRSHARQLAEKLAETGKFPPEEYNEFMDAAANFNEMIFKLQRETLFQVAHIDDLTGAGDEMAMRDYIEAERERVMRMDQEATVAVCELSEYTGQDGETVDVSRADVLVEFAITLAAQLRPYDQLYRINNDLFLICLPYTDVTVAELVIKRLHGKVSGSPLNLKNGTQVKLSTHIGIAPIGAEESVETILEHANEALELARANELVDVYSWEGQNSIQWVIGESPARHLPLPAPLKPDRPGPSADQSGIFQSSDQFGIGCR